MQHPDAHRGRAASAAPTTKIERLTAEFAELQRSARLTDLRYRQILASATDYAIILLDCEGIVIRWNTGAENILGWLEAEMVGRRCDRIFTPEDLAAGVPAAEQKTALTSGRSMDERWHVRKDGSRLWSSGFVMGLGDGENVLKIMRDDTARRRAEEAQQALIAELNHRIKNILTVVQAVALQTLRNTQSPQDGTDALIARLQVLARAHDVLTQGQWEHTDLARLIQQCLAPLHGIDLAHNFTIDGPPVEVRPAAALTLAMALHELDTNALKYGALTAPDGRADIRWTVHSDLLNARLHFEWRESGGPPVASPARRGFGSRLIETGLARELHGESHPIFEPAGLRCVIDAPLAALTGNS